MPLFEGKNVGMFPAIAGLSMLAANQPRPASQGPVSFGSVLGQGGLNAFKYMEALKAAEAKREDKKTAREDTRNFRKESIDLRRSTLENQKKKTSAYLKSLNKPKTITSGALTGLSTRDDGVIIDPQTGGVIGPEEIKRRVTNDRLKGRGGQTNTAFLPIPDPNDPNRFLLGRLVDGQLQPATMNGEPVPAVGANMAAERLDISAANSRTAQGNLKQRSIDNLIDSAKQLSMHVKRFYPKGAPKLQAIENWLGAKKRGTRTSTTHHSLMLAYLHAKYPDDTTFSQDQIDQVYSEHGLVEAVGTSLSGFFAGRPQLREDVVRNMEDFVVDFQQNLQNRMLTAEAQFTGNTGIPGQTVPPPAEEDLGEIPPGFR